MNGLFVTSRRHWWERVNSTVIEFHLTNISRSRRTRTRIASLVERDANDCAISPPRLPFNNNILVCIQQKGSGYHLDLFLIAIQIAICSVLGLPWYVAATVLSINHVRSLTKESECAAPGERPKFLGIRFANSFFYYLRVATCQGKFYFFKVREF